MPVIIVSAFATGDDMKQFIASGASATLSKPFGLSEMIALIASFIKPE